jgi:hypothetical protein
MIQVSETPKVIQQILVSKTQIVTDTIKGLNEQLVPFHKKVHEAKWTKQGLKIWIIDLDAKNGS